MNNDLLHRRTLLGRICYSAFLFSLPGKTSAGVRAPSALETLAALARVVHPHDWLAPGFYDEISRRYWGEVQASPAARKELLRGLELLDKSYIAPFARLPAAIQIAMVNRYDQEPFFRAFLWRAAELVYRDPVVWSHIGYEGPALPKGGYLHRGFDDISWLPDRLEAVDESL